MPGDSIATERGFLKEQPRGHSRRKGGLKSPETTLAGLHWGAAQHFFRAADELRAMSAHTNDVAAVLRRVLLNLAHEECEETLATQRPVHARSEYKRVLEYLSRYGIR